MTEAVVSSFNFYVDSERDRSASSKGDDIIIPLQETPIRCATNQYLRLTLQTFSMYSHSMPRVNPTNCIFRVSCEKTAGGVTLINKPFALDIGNYSSSVDLMLEFGRVLSGAIFECTGVNPDSTAPVLHMNSDFSATSSKSLDNIMRLRLQFDGNHLVKANSLLVKFVITDGDSFALLGGNRIYDEGETTSQSTVSSIVIDTTSATNSIDVTGMYNVQLSTEESIYLKCDTATTAIQTTSYSSLSTDKKQAGDGTESSRILGRIVQDTFFSLFTTSTDREFFVNLSQKNLTNIRLFLQDSKGREIPQCVPRTLALGLTGTRYFPAMKVASGHSEAQATLGNRSFEAVIRVDVIQFLSPQNNQLQSKPFVPNTPPRYSSNLLPNFEGAYYPPDKCRL